MMKKLFEKIKTEVQLLKELHHPNIVTYLQTDLPSDNSGIYVLLEYVPGGSLKRLISKYGHLEESIIKNFTFQLLQGLSFLHLHGIIHRDLKSDNVLVTSDGKIKLSDFGCSVRSCSFQRDITKSIKGSPCFIAPEILLRQIHSYSADIWSVGCMIIEMLTGEAPWSNITKDQKQLLRIIAYSKIKPDVPNCSDELKDVINLCLQRNPVQRPTASQLLEHRFFKEKQESTESSNFNISRISSTRDYRSKGNSDSLRDVYRDTERYVR